MKKILVTGGTGFIGAYLVRRLVDRGYDVLVIDNDLRGRAGRLARVKEKIDLIECDVRDADAVTAASKDVDCIVHLAALNGTENFYNKPDLVLDVGVKGMFSVLEAARKNKITQFVLASSAEAYQTPPVIPTPEDVPLVVPDTWNPRFSYGGSKLISELMLANYNRDLFERAVIFRPHNVYGPDMGWEHVLPQFVVRAHDQIEGHPTGVVPFEIQGDGLQTRAFIYIDDLVDGLVTVVERGEHRNVYHIGTREERTIREVVDYVFEYFGREKEIIESPLTEGSTSRRCPDTAKIEKLGFTQSVPFRDGFAKLATWYLDHMHLRSS